MAGVNRAAVAVTDTFDVWRVRTNELNTSLNAGTHAKTADTIVWRDDDASLVANVVTANTLTMTHETGTATLVVASALAADATKASIQTTGGIKADLGSKFGAAVDVTGALTVGGHTTLGNAAGTDTVTLTGRVASIIDVATSITYDIGDSLRLSELINKQDLNNYIKQVIEYSFDSNKYFNDSEPWSLKKTDVKKMNSILYSIVEQIKNISILLLPIIPISANKILDIINVEKELRKITEIENNKSLNHDKELQKIEILFKKVE